MINIEKLTKEFIKAGIEVSGCNANGVVWDVDGTTEIQGRPIVKSIIALHDPTPEPEPPTMDEQIADLKQQVSDLTDALVNNSAITLDEIPSIAAMQNTMIKPILTEKVINN